MTPFPSVNANVGALAPITTFQVDNFDIFSLQVANLGNNPLTAFEIWAQISPGAPFAKVAGGAADMNSSSLLFDGVTAAPETLPAGAVSIIVTKPRGFYMLQVRAASGLGTSVQLDASGHQVRYYD